jgi:hypothetical protein
MSDVRLEINLHKLHEEAAMQAVYYGEAAQKAADLKGEVHRAKLKLDTVRAEVDAEVRTNPEGFGLSKVTESAISGAVTLDSRVQDAEREHLEAQRANDNAQVMVNALEHRRSMINNEVQLYVSQYWVETNQAEVNTGPVAVEARKRDIDKIRQMRRRRIVEGDNGNEQDS